MTRRVLIVGAGIAGLTLARALSQRGLQVQVLERVTEWQAVGAGITLGVNAMNLLEQLGLGQQIRALGAPIAGGQVTDERGRALQTFGYGALARYGESVALHRADLQAALLQDMEPLVELGSTVTALTQTRSGVDVTLSTGRQNQYDVVIGADGLHSGVRSLLFGPVQPRYAGYTSWRFVVPQTVPLPVPVEMWGRGQRLGLVPIGQERLYGFATANTPAHAADPPLGRAQRLRELLHAFEGDAPQVLSALQDAQVIHTDLHEVQLPRWTLGRVGLIGDAAHAMTPNLGQGAGMGIEDAVVLAGLLAAGGEVAGALSAFEVRRRQRVGQIQRQSRLLGRAGQLRAAPLVAARNMMMRATPERIMLQNLRNVLTGEGAIRAQP